MNCLFPPPLALLPRLNLLGFRVHSNPWRGPGAICFFRRQLPRARKVGTSERSSEVPAEGELLGRPTLATLESTAFLALGFGAVNGQDFRTRRDPLGRFTLFLISQLVSGSRVSLTQGRAGPAGVETAGREHGSCNHAVGE